MLFEVEEENRDFVTNYKNDFIRQKYAKLKGVRPLRPYPLPLNILNGPYKKCLNTRPQNLSLPVEERSVDSQDFLNSVREKRYWLKKSLPESLPDENFIESKEKEYTKTIYTLDYCDAPWINIRRRIKKPAVLPEGWIIPETNQKRSYRNPRNIADDSLLRVERGGKPLDNLSPNPKEREILRVRTGDTEYNSSIDTTAYRIMKGSPLGVPLPVKFLSDYEEKPKRTEPLENLALPSRLM